MSIFIGNREVTSVALGNLIIPSIYKGSQPVFDLSTQTEDLGPELVTNGDFSNGDTGWGKTQATINNGEANIVSTDGSYAAVTQNILTVGKTYKYYLEIKELTGTVAVFMGNGVSAGGSDSFTTVGVKEGFLVANGTTGLFQIARSGVCDATIDNISVKEVFNLGPELLTNGDFSNGSEGWTLNDSATVQDSKLVINTDNGEQNFLQSNVLQIGKEYRLTLDADLDVGVIRFESGEGANYLIDTSTQKVVHYFTADFQNLIFRRNVAPTRGTFDNISVKEILSDSEPFDSGLLLNGTFETSDNITLEPEWTIVSEEAVFDGNGGAIIFDINQNLSTGTAYTLTFTAPSYGATLRFKLTGFDSGYGYSDDITSFVTYTPDGNDVVTVNFTTPSDAGRGVRTDFRIQGSTISDAFTIDNVSLTQD